MDLRAPLQLKSMIKSMSDVVLPAIDPGNRMAQEQAQLILGMMHLMALRLPLQFHYDLDELKRYLGLAQELLRQRAGGAQSDACQRALGQSSAPAADVLARAQAAPRDLESAVMDLRADISALVEALWQDDAPEARAPAARAVLAAATAQIERERAWFAPQGWDADTSTWRSIESLIDYPANPSEPTP